MNRLLVCIAALLPALANAGLVDNTEPAWIPIFGLKSTPSYTVMFDSSSYQRSTTRNQDIATGDFVLISSQPVNYIVNRKVVSATAVVKTFGIECKKQVIVPIVEFYYSTKGAPALRDDPVAAKEYSLKDDMQSPIGKSSQIYKTLCSIAT